MEPTTQWKFRWFWPWQDDREEAWLGNLSREGWHLSGFGFPRIYNFQKGDPKNFVYRLDYQTSRMRDRETYLQLFRDAGWEPVGKMAAWEYFRKETAGGEEPEIFTDLESETPKVSPNSRNHEPSSYRLNAHRPGAGIFDRSFGSRPRRIAMHNCRGYYGIWGYGCRALSQGKAATGQSAKIGRDSRGRQSRTFQL